MEHGSDEHHRFSFTSDHLARLKSVVKGKALDGLGEADLNDIAGEILLSACVSAARADTTVPLAALAFSYAAMPSYYTTMRRAAASIAPEGAGSSSESATDANRSFQAVEIRDVLRTLSAESGRMILACDVAGKTLAETATVFGVSTATAHRRLTRAHDDFRAAWFA